MKIFFLAFVLMLSFVGYSRQLHVGANQTYVHPGLLQGLLKAGDTVLLHGGSYTGTFFLTDVIGSSANPIVFKAFQSEAAIFSGGTESFHFSDAAYIVIQDLIFERQTGNGMNIDDAGTFATPSHHITIKNCIFRNTNASGNNDMLKLSGIDDFEISNCTFTNGATGGSGVDMVGCHRGLFIRNTFSNQGSNSIQIKGGSEQITITQSKFTNGGARALNIGGSTGLEFFRPQNAKFEAARVFVYANVFEGGETPFAFVGAIHSKVYNNTIINPDRWAMRILQETVDASRFEPCGKDSVINNIFILKSSTGTEVNIGPNTAPATFFYSNNIWYKENNASWSGPSSLPVSDKNQIVGNPMINTLTYKISAQSNAYKKGLFISNLYADYYNKNYLNPPSIGVAEIEGTTPVIEVIGKPLVRLYPNPASSILKLEYDHSSFNNYRISRINGQLVSIGKISPGISTLDISNFVAGIYLISFEMNNQVIKWVKE